MIAPGHIDEPGRLNHKLSAGEITFARQDTGWTVTEVSNQSTGYCPEPSWWPVVAAACERAGLPHPGGFTTAFEFRRCSACDQLTIVKDDDFTCAIVGGAQPGTGGDDPERPYRQADAAYSRPPG